MNDGYHSLIEWMNRSKQILFLLISLSGIFSVFGSIFIVIYFMGIHYIPSMSITDLSLVFIISGVYGVLLMLLTGVGLLSPALFGHIVLHDPEVKKALLFVKDPRTKGHIELKEWQKQFKAVFRWFGLPILIMFAMTLFTVPGGYFECIGRVVVFVIGFLLMVLYSVFLKNQFNIAVLSIVGSNVLAMLAAEGLSVVLSAWLLIFGDLSRRSSNFDFYGFVILGISLIVGVISIIAMIPPVGFLAKASEISRNGVWFLLVGFLASMPIFAILGHEGIPGTIARTAGFGVVFNAKVVLDSEAKDAVELMSLKCKPRNLGVEVGLCLLDNVNILWGRGDEYLFEFKNRVEAGSGQSEENGREILDVRFTVLRSHVVSIFSEPGEKSKIAP